MTGSNQNDVNSHDTLYINGEWVAPTASGTLDVINSTTEEVMGRVPEGTAEDIDRAVQAARAAFESWSTTDPSVRAAVVKKISEGVKARQSEIASVSASEPGTPPPLATACPAGK